MPLQKFPTELTAAVRTTPAAVNSLAVVALLILVAKILCLDSLPEIFPNAADFGHQFEELLNAVIAAWIFFIISYQVPQAIERMRVGRAMVRLSYSVSSAVYQIYVLLGDPNVDLTKVDLALVKERFERAAPNASSPILSVATLQPLTWLQVLISQKDLYCEYIDAVWRYDRFVEAELAELLDRIQFSSFSRQMDLIRHAGKMGNGNLGVWSSAYSDCFVAARDLAAYCDRYRSIYKLS